MAVALEVSRKLAASPEYVKRLQDWVVAEAAKAADPVDPGDKGVNAYSALTYKLLERYGRPGFSTTVISRWINGKVLDEVRGSSLERIGLLRGYSSDPERAKHAAYLWLTTGQEPSDAPPPSPPQPVPSGHGAPSATAQILDLLQEPLSAVQLRQIVESAIAKMFDHANFTPVEQEEPPMSKQAIAYVVKGWMEENGKSLQDLAQALDVSEDRATQIVARSPLTEEECKAIARLTKLDVEVIRAWGLVPKPPGS